jgi:sn-glycerol 3-phosphate transport system substrate-binding protein
LSSRLYGKGRFFVLLLCVFLSITGLMHAGGRRPSSPNEEIQFWHSMGTHEKEVLSSMVAEYNSGDRQPAVQAVFQGSDSDLFLNLMSQDKLPELVLLPVHYLNVLRERGIVADVSTFIPNRIRDDIDAKYWDSVSIEGGTYGVPFSFNSTILYVNQYLLRISGTRIYREPETWEEVEPILVKIRDNAEGKWGLFIPMEGIQHFIAFVESFTGKAVLNDQRLIVNSKEAVRAMTALQGFVYRQQFMPPKLTSAEAEQMFLSGNLGIVMGSSSRLVFTKSNLPYNLTVWGMPSPGQTPPIISGVCLAVTKEGIHRGRDIFQFIEFLISEDNAIKWHTRTGSPPLLNSTKESLDLLIFYEENPNYMTSIIEMEGGRVFAPPFDVFQADTITRRALERIMVGGEEPARILDELQRELDMLLLTAM